MLISNNNYLFVEKVEDQELQEDKGIIYDNNMSKDKIIRGRVFEESDGECMYSTYTNGTEVLCDIVGAREFTYKGRNLYIITVDSVFGMMKYGTEPGKFPSADPYGEEQ